MTLRARLPWVQAWGRLGRAVARTAQYAGWVIQRRFAWVVLGATVVTAIILWAALTGTGASAPAPSAASECDTRLCLTLVPQDGSSVAGQVGVFSTKEGDWQLHPVGALVQIRYKDVVALGQKLTYRNKEERGVLDGAVRITKGTDRMEADSLEFDAAKELYTLSGNVKIEQPRQRTNEQNGSNELRVLLANRVVYDAKTDDFTATGNVRLSEGEQRLTANQATYREKSRELELTGNVTMNNKDAHFQVSKMNIDLDNEIVYLFGPVLSGAVRVKEQQEQ